jgi:hypothetical protein
MLLSHQNTGQNHKIRMASISLGNMAQFEYLGMILINHNFIQREIGDQNRVMLATIQSRQNLLSSHLLPKKD